MFNDNFMHVICAILGDLERELQRKPRQPELIKQQLLYWRELYADGRKKLL